MATAASLLQNPAWDRVPISQIEVLHEAVLGADCNVVQFSQAPISGSLAFAQFDGVTFSSASIEGHVGVSGPLSASDVTLGVMLDAGEGTHQWQNEVGDFATGVFRPSDEHDAYYRPGALYGAITLAEERLEAIAADKGLVLDGKQLGGTGVSGTRIDSHKGSVIRQGLRAIHGKGSSDFEEGRALARVLLDALVNHYAREPQVAIGMSPARQNGQIVRRACAYIAENLEEPLTVEALARAANTSRRTLYRAFEDILDESPLSYVRKLRLNRIRQDLASEAEIQCTITVVSNRWGISELGRMSGMYRELFGELPSKTLLRYRRKSGRRAELVPITY